MHSLAQQCKAMYREYGPAKAMGDGADSKQQPHYFLHRAFCGDQDLLVILNTKRCKYQCHFCQLPAKSSLAFIPRDDIIAQFSYVVEELRHSLGVLTRITLSNEGSVLDAETLPTNALAAILEGAAQLPSIRRVVLETRLEFVDATILESLATKIPRAQLDILTGFETLNERIRNDVLVKHEPLPTFLRGLDEVANANTDLTAYVLFKPDPNMTDAQALEEAHETVEYLISNCDARGVHLSFRVNPMYAAAGSRWAQMARDTPAYAPPRVTDVVLFAETIRNRGFAVYVGLSTEGLDESWGNYRSREDFSGSLLRPIIEANAAVVLTVRGQSVEANHP